jgi:hypothetical protein
MKPTQLFFIGIFTCIIGSIVLWFALQVPVGARPEPIKTVVGFVLVGLGGYIIYRGKKQERVERRK